MRYSTCMGTSDTHDRARMTATPTAARAERLLDQLVRSTTEGILAFDRELRYTLWNPAMERISGLPASRVLGRRAPEVFPFLEEIGELEYFRAALAGRTVTASHREYRVPETGRHGRFEGRYAPLLGEDGRVQGGLAIVQDVTEQEENRLALRSLSHRLLEVQEEERARIARELHDQVGQVLSAVKLTLETANQMSRGREVRAPISEAIRVVEEAVRQVRDLAYTLRPSLLDDLGLAAAVAAFARRQAGLGGIAVDVHVPQAHPPLAPVVELACFRILQEAIANILRHAHATAAVVELQVVEAVTLTVADNGRGFPADELLGRGAGVRAIGLLGMRERAELVGGSLTIRSERGRGTVVEATLPLVDRPG